MPKLNKPARPGYRYAHPEETSAQSYMPHPEEDVVRSQRSDVERMRRGLSANAAREYNRRLQQEAAGRAMLRTAGRAGLAGTALQGGYDVGRELDERTGAGRKLVEASGLGKAAERVANRRDKVSLTPEARQRLEDMEDLEIAREVESEMAAEREAKRPSSEGMKKGGAARGWGKARGARKAKVY